MPKIHKIKDKKNHFGDVLTNIFYNGDVLTNFWGRFDQFGDVLTRGRFDCNPLKLSFFENFTMPILEAGQVWEISETCDQDNHI